MHRIFLASLLFASLSGAAAVHAEVFRWTDANGVVHYADKPLAPNAKPAALPSLQTYPAGTPPPLIADAAAAPAGGGIRITAPAAGTTLNETDAGLTVEVATAFEPGQGLIYYLDDTAQNSKPTPSTALLVARLGRGKHTLGASLVDPTGRELSRAAPVTIYVKP